MSGNPNTNNLVSYRARGFKRGSGLQVRFNNRTGCRQVVCRKKKCKVTDKSPSFIKVGNTVYKLDLAGGPFPDTENIGNAIYAYNFLYNNKNISAWYIFNNGKYSIFSSNTLLDKCFPITKIYKPNSTIDKEDLINKIISNGKIIKSPPFF